MALRVVYDGAVYVVIRDIDAAKSVYKTTIGKDQQFEWMRWAGNNRLIVSISMVGQIFDDEVRFTRLFLIDLKTGNASIVAKKQEGPIGDDILYVDPAGEFVLIAMQKTIYDWPSVWRYPLDGTSDKNAHIVQKQKEYVWNWYADDAGVVRMGTGWVGKKYNIWYRKDPAGDFQKIASIAKDEDDKFLDVEHIVSGSDEGYVLEKAGDTVALKKYNFATRTSGEIVYQNPQWDVSEAYVGDDGKPSSAYYTDDKERVVWFDPKMKAMQTRLTRALPNKDFWVISRARDDSRMLVWVGHEDDPGALFIFTAADRSLKFFDNYRPAVNQELLTTPKPISYVARDKTLIRGYLTLPRGREAKGLPLIILPHGGPYGVRDTLDYSDEVQFLANRGYAVLQPNYRGSGGFGEAFDTIAKGQIGRKMQDDLDDGMDWLVKEGIVDPKRVCLVGSSYGGYAALWGVIRNPERYRCAASFAGVTDWAKWVKYSSRGDDGKDRRDWEQRVRGDDPKFDLDSISPSKQTARITRPVLLTHGDKDSRVPFSQFQSMRDAALKAKAPVETVVFTGEGHGFDKPENEQKWYDSLEVFLTKNNPADGVSAAKP